MESTEQTNPAEQSETAEQRDLPLNELSIPALAYLGDSVLELTVRRELVLRRGLSTAGDLNRASLAYVSAGAQSAAMERMLPLPKIWLPLPSIIAISLILALLPQISAP